MESAVASLTQTRNACMGNAAGMCMIMELLVYMCKTAPAQLHGL